MMNQRKILSRYAFGILVASIFLLALFVRTYFPYVQIFGSGMIKFAGNDAYFHMRLVDNIVANFPQVTRFDPYLIFPGSGMTSGFNFFDWFLAAIIRLVSFGSPTERLIDVIGVFYPAVLGALTIVPVYFLGKELFGRWAGVIASVLVAFLPGEFLSRSILGFTDHHVAEVLLSTTGILFLTLALKQAGRACGTNTAGWMRNLVRPIILSLVGGLFMGLYFVTWIGAQLFVFTVFFFCVCQIIIDHLRGNHTTHLGILSFAFFAGLITIYLATSRVNLSFNIIPLVIALVGPPILTGLSLVFNKIKMKLIYFPIAILTLGMVIIGVAYAVLPDLAKSIQQAFSLFIPTTGTGLTTLEMRPFFAPVVEGGGFFLTPAWLNLYAVLPLSIIGFFILAWAIAAKQQFVAERVLFLVWSLLIFAITVQQRRYGYYFTVNAALLTGYVGVMIYVLIVQAIEYLRTRDAVSLRRQIREAAGLEITVQSELVQVFHGTERKKQSVASYQKNYLGRILAVLLVFSLVVFPGLGTTVQIAQAATFVTPDAWNSALIWLKDNSPEPLGDPQAYYRMYPADFNYPETAYGIMSWWDYGYWITRIAHRIPVTNPSQDTKPIREAAGVFLSQNESAARDVIRQTKTGYIIADDAMVTSKLWAIAQWNGQDQGDYYGSYVFSQGDQLFRTTFYYPEYYRSLLVRLYNFDGKSVVPEKIRVISYEDKVVQEKTTGQRFSVRMVTDDQTFPNYQAAIEFIKSHQGDYRIVSNNPFVSGVPLEKLMDYRLVFSSEQASLNIGSIRMPQVKIFEVKTP